MTDETIEKVQASQTLEFLTGRALGKGEHEKAVEYRLLRQFCGGPVPKNWLEYRAEDARKVLEKLDTNADLAAVYAYLDPVIKKYEGGTE